MKIDCYIDKKTFKDFTFFNVIKRLKGYKTPLIFSISALIISTLCFFIKSISYAKTIGSVLFLLSLLAPICYFVTFFYSLNKQVKVQKLENPQFVYSIELQDEKIVVTKDSDSLNVKWSDIFKVYFAPSCIYLFVNNKHAFLIPQNSASDFSSVKDLIKAKLDDKIIIIK